VFQIRDIWVRVRIRILGLTDPHPNPALDPALFLSDLQDVNKNLLFCLVLFEDTFTSFFNDKKSYSHKTAENKVLLTVLALSWKDPGLDPDPEVYL